jgi:hypothetical protein
VPRFPATRLRGGPQIHAVSLVENPSRQWNPTALAPFSNPFPVAIPLSHFLMKSVGSPSRFSFIVSSALLALSSAFEFGILPGLQLSG